MASQVAENSQIASEYNAPPPPTHSLSPPFGVVTDLFERLSKEKKHQSRMKLLNAWINKWRQNVGYDLYPPLRLLLPQKDRERAVYHVKEKSLVRAYIAILGLDKKADAAKRLIDWKKPTEKDKSAGDFPTVLYEIVSSRSSVTSGSLSVDEVNALLDELSKHGSKQEDQTRIIREIFNKSTPVEQRWIIRIILKDLIISVKEGTVFSVFHPDAQAAFNACSDLKRVCYELWDPERRLDDGDKNVHIFRPFAPMLCKRPIKRLHLALKEAVSNMGGSQFIIEEKLDGERIQLHKRGNEYFYCSRKGKDYTYLYGKHVGTGSLTPWIDSAFDPRVQDVILDGEMLVWDPIAEQYLPFGSLKTAAGAKIKKLEDPRPCFKVFDLLYLNGQSLLHKSLTFRKKNMRQVFKEIKGRIELATEYRGSTKEDVKKRLDEVIETKGEGLVLKHPQSQYVLNGRLNDWTKVKPEYMDDMGETVDVLVVAGNYGTGKRGGGVSTLVCALRDDRDPNEGSETKYSTFARIGSGLSFTDYVWIREKPWVEYDKNDPPDFLQVAPKGQEDKGDVYLNPADSFILKIKAAEITVSDQYHINLTLRFPRAMRIRDDLTIDDCMTVTEILERVQSGTKRKMHDSVGNTKKRKTTKKTAVLVNQGADVSGVQLKLDLFSGRMFLVVPDATMTAQNKQDLERLIYEYGGNFRQVVRNGNEDPVTVVFGGKNKTAQLTPHIKAGRTIVRPQWIYDCVAARKLFALRGKYYFRDIHQEQDDSVTEDEKELVLYKEEEDNPMIETLAESTVSTGTNTQTIKTEDSEYSDWFKIDTQETESRFEDLKASDTETEGASDEDDDPWIKAEEPDENEGWLETKVAVPMGENDSAREYDQEQIFKHLVFYLDTPENARKHSMKVNSRHEDETTASFTKAEKDVLRFGGRITDDLDDQKLTHIVLDRRDTSRRVELNKRTALPRRRHLVLLSFVEFCVDERTLLDEDSFTP